MEENANSTVIFKTLYPKIERALASNNNLAKLREFYGDVINRNNEALSEIIPSKAVFMDKRIEDKYYKAIDLDPKEIMMTLKMSGHVGDNWHTVQNPMYVSLMLLLLYFNNKKKQDMVNQTIFICSLYMYRNVRSKYFSKVSEKTINCMKFTISRLSYKNDLKKCGSIMKTISKKNVSFLNNLLTEHKEEIKGEVTDRVICNMINRNHRDYAKMLNNFYAEFRKDLDAGNYLNVDEDIDDGETYIESDNVSFMVEKNTQKVMNKFILTIYPNGKIMEQVCAREPGCSINNLRNMLAYIYDNNHKEFEKLVRVIIQIYLFEYKKKVDDLRTFDFEITMKAHYKKQSATDKNLMELRGMVDNVIEKSGLSDRISRKATLNDCKRAFVLYVLVYIRYALIS
jgi:hypothetical protein